uniref:Ycf3 n=1 Tax=Davallia solida var. fejeensis TaxID=328198 RepID=A0A5B9RFS9_DAVSF|nr:Ycf3 [Davallia solida var. fejeensis]QEG57970.1 Ycf3 [Davallia solida var. fejeensis]
MPRSQRNDNFIDKTFTILADILLQILPTTKREREASTYYRDGCRPNLKGNMQKLYEVITKPCVQRLTLMIEATYFTTQASLIQVMENMQELWNITFKHRSEILLRHKLLIIWLRSVTTRGEQAINQGNLEISEAWFDQAAEYWKQAIAPSPGNYIEAQNRLKITGRFSLFN